MDFASRVSKRNCRHHEIIIKLLLEALSSMVMTGSWSIEEDLRLWHNRSKPASSLAVEFDRSVGGIRSRLTHLRDKTHNAYKRLHESAHATPEMINIDHDTSRKDSSRRKKKKRSISMPELDPSLLNSEQKVSRNV